MESEIRFGAGLGEEELEKGMGWGKERGRRSRSYSTVFFLFPFRGGPERHKLPFKSDTGGQGCVGLALVRCHSPPRKNFLAFEMRRYGRKKILEREVLLIAFRFLGNALEQQGGGGRGGALRDQNGGRERKEEVFPLLLHG